jgi:hypothetical protein
MATGMDSVIAEEEWEQLDNEGEASCASGIALESHDVCALVQVRFS